MDEKIANETIEFLESHEDLVNKDDWESIYAKSSFPSLLTTYLHELGFDPLPYMKSIPDQMYFKCSWLDSITIPNSVTSISYGAFYGCSGLTSITYNGTKSQWLLIQTGSYWKDFGVISVHCSNGDIIIN